MNECPTCGRRLRGDICPYCDEEGRAEEDTESNPVTGESLIAVYACDEEREARHVLSLLESEGIPAFRSSALDVDESSDIGDLEGDIIISVSEEDEDRARDIIEAAESGMEDED
jgi:hypothetical protein